MILGIVAGGGGAAASGPADELYPLVQSLLHFDGADGSTTFTDQRGVTWTPSGNAQLDTAQSKWGTASLLLDGTGDFLDAADSDLVIGTGDFTLEAHVRFGSTSGNRFIATWSGGWGLYQFSGQWAVFDGVSNNPILGGSVTTNTWYHVRLCRRGTSLRLFVDGVQIGSTATNSTNFSSNAWRIGAQSGGGGALQGHIDDFRLTMAARSVAAFTPPSEAHPNRHGDPFFDDVVALNHWNGTNGATTFADEISGVTWTTGAGAVALSTTTPFAGSAAVKFPGTGGNRVDSNDLADFAFGTGDFTIEMRFRTANAAATQMLWDQRTSLSQPRPCIFTQSSQLLWFINNGVQITGGALTANTWQHIAVSRVSGVTRMYIDGTQTGSNFTDSTNYSQARIRLGTAGDSPGFGDHAGAYDELRVTKGVGRYATNFAPLPIAFADAA